MKKLLMLLSCTVIHTFCTSPKLHELWWTKNLDAKMALFASWLGDEEADSRVKIRNHIVQCGYKSILDVPCGLCTEYLGYQKYSIDIDYYGIDITPQLVLAGQQRGINVIEGTIEKLPCSDSTVDVCYARHILEHLDYYHKAIDELVRVARKEVIIIFFIKPDANNDHIDLSMMDGAWLYHNRYNKELLEQHVQNNAKVSHLVWQELNEQECALHIYLTEK